MSLDQKQIGIAPLESETFTEKHRRSASTQHRLAQPSPGGTLPVPFSPGAQQQNDELPITTRQAVEFFCDSIHPKTLERKARRGEIPAYQLFGRWFYFKSELRAYLQRQQVKFPQPIGPA